MTLPPGFRHEDEPGAFLLVNHGPQDTAAGRFGDSAAPALWTRQVLSDGRLRALIVVPPTAGELVTQFEAVHGVAEQIAERLAVGAVEVAVSWDELDGRDYGIEADNWRITALAGGRLVVLLTDAVVSADALATALTDVWTTGDTVLAMASGASGSSPDSTEFGDALFTLHEDAR